MMMKGLLKAAILGLVLLFTMPTQAQIYQKFPTNIRYIGGGFNNVRPFFKTLEAALNDVKAFATSDNPYGFWVSSDTLWIADWDSVFTSSGLTMKDSIDIYYVTTGKIKWMPFGFGGSGGSGSSTIITQDDSTLHYKWPTWDQTNIALPLWQRKEGAAMDSVDEEIWRLIVYTKDPLYIENDTLKIDTTGFGGITSNGWNPDTTTIVRTTTNQIIADTKTFTGSVKFSNYGNIQLPSINGNTGTARILWGNTANMYYSGAGVPGDSSIVVLIKNSTKHAIRDTFITNSNLAYDVYNYFTKGDTVYFAGTKTSMNIPVAGMTAASIVVVTPVYTDSSTVVNTADFCVAVPYSGGFYLKRGAGGTSNLKVNWAWIKRTN